MHHHFGRPSRFQLDIAHEGPTIDSSPISRAVNWLRTFKRSTGKIVDIGDGSILDPGDLQPSNIPHIIVSAIAVPVFSHLMEC